MIRLTKEDISINVDGPYIDSLLDIKETNELDKLLDKVKLDVVHKFNAFEDAIKLSKRLDAVISEMQYNKDIKNLQNNYHIVLEEMKNLRDGIPVGGVKQ